MASENYLKHLRSEVQHLHRQDMSSHPIFWEDDEVDWLGPSPEGFESAPWIAFHKHFKHIVLVPLFTGM